MTDPTTESKINEIFSLYESFGNADYIGEPVSQIEHMSQAAQMAEKEGYGKEVILAAFFHIYSPKEKNWNKWMGMGLWIMKN